jgi:hypothetical protein
MQNRPAIPSRFGAKTVTSSSSRADDVFPDGGFIMIKGSRDLTARFRINVVFNWFEELKERVPTGRGSQ